MASWQLTISRGHAVLTAGRRLAVSRQPVEVSSECLFWPVEGTPASEVNGADVGPILLLGETLDAPTPIEGSYETRRRFPSATLIATQGGRTHGAGLSGNPCVDEPIARYFATGALPERQDGDHADVVCDPLPLPEPTMPGVYAAPDPNAERRALLRELLARVHR